MSFSDYYGLDLIWFLGVVEDRKDPLKIGRCRVRCFGFHTENLEDLPTQDLPWAQLLIPANSNYEIKPPKEGSWVIGFFKDGKYCQEPMILSLVPGIPTVPAEDGKDRYIDEESKQQMEDPVPKKVGFYDLGSDISYRPTEPQDLELREDGSGIKITKTKNLELYPKSKEGKELPFMKNVIEEPDTSRVARNESIDKTLIQKRVEWLQKNVPTALSKSDPWNEPDSNYSADYPYNKVEQTESGHLFEVDDTKGSERISQQHRVGTFYEINPDGSKVEKIVKDNFHFVYGNDYKLNFGEYQINIKKDKGELIEGNYYIEVKKETHLKSKNDIYIDSETGIIHLNKNRS